MTLGKAAAVHLGLIVWCRPKRRSDTARRDDDGAGLERRGSVARIAAYRTRIGGGRSLIIIAPCSPVASRWKPDSIEGPPIRDIVQVKEQSDGKGFPI
jgi:hypothetical protein